VVDRLRAAGCVFAEDEAALLIAAATAPEDLGQLVAQRVAGVPLEHVLGWVEFCGRRYAVAAGVFVPRRRTEFLVEQAVARTARDAVVVELCCGCAAVGAAVAAAGAGVQLHVADVEPAATACARRNVEPFGGRVHTGDLFEPLPRELRGAVDVLIANAPYVPSVAVALMPPEARVHEPLVALDGGADGLDVLRRVIAGARPWLAPGGSVLVECGRDQVAPLRAAMTAAGFTAEMASSEDELEATVVIGTA
jgi:release factor glutamine methyltransferase